MPITKENLDPTVREILLPFGMDGDVAVGKTAAGATERSRIYFSAERRLKILEVEYTVSEAFLTDVGSLNIGPGTDPDATIVALIAANAATTVVDRVKASQLTGAVGAGWHPAGAMLYVTLIGVGGTTTAGEVRGMVRALEELLPDERRIS